MGYVIPSSNDFKLQFQRDFMYSVPGFGAVIQLTLGAGSILGAQFTAGGYNYQAGAGVTITDPTGTGAKLTATVQGGQGIGALVVALPGSGYTNPTAILYGGDNSDQKKVTDTDINGALADADINMNESNFPTQISFTRGYLFLSAHCLCQTILASVEGLASQNSWLTNSKSVHDVSQDFYIPERIKEDAFLASLSTTTYGLKYLQMIMPYLVGHVAALYRVTNPV